jgi:hypothetical protein
VWDSNLLNEPSLLACGATAAKHSDKTVTFAFILQARFRAQAAALQTENDGKQASSKNRNRVQSCHDEQRREKISDQRCVIGVCHANRWAQTSHQARVQVLVARKKAIECPRGHFVGLKTLLPLVVRPADATSDAHAHTPHDVGEDFNKELRL